MPAVLVEAQAVEVGTIESTYASTGSLRAEREALVKARSRGIVEAISVEEGDTVESGSLLTSLEDDELRIAKDRAKATAANAKIKYDRAERLKSQKLISIEEYHESRHTWEVANADAERALLELSYTKIRSPIPGTVAERRVSVGQEVSAGDVLFRIVDESPLILDLHVPETLVGRLATGQSVDLTIDASEEELQGKIARISPVVDVNTGTVKVTVELDGNESVRTGSFARARVVTDRHENATIVPRDSIVSEGGTWYVFHVEQGVAKKVPVELGFEEADRVELLDGPGPGTVVVVTGAAALQDGMPVEVIESAASEQEPAVPEKSAANAAG